MKIKIQTASREAEIAILCMFRTKNDQMIALSYSSGMYIMLEQLLFDTLSPMFPLDSREELDRLFKSSPHEVNVFMNVEIERLTEIEMEKVLSAPLYKVYYRKNEKYFNLVKFEHENEEAPNFVFQQHGEAAPQNMLMMQPVDVEEGMNLDRVLERIQEVGVKNITKLERNYLQRISNQ